MVPPPELYSFRLQTPMSNFTAVIPMKCSLCRRYYLLERKLRGSDRLLRFDGCITPIYFSTPRNHCARGQCWRQMSEKEVQRTRPSVSQLWVISVFYSVYIASSLLEVDLCIHTMGSLDVDKITEINIAQTFSDVTSFKNRQNWKSALSGSPNDETPHTEASSSEWWRSQKL